MFLKTYVIKKKIYKKKKYIFFIFKKKNIPFLFIITIVSTVYIHVERCIHWLSKAEIDAFLQRTISLQQCEATICSVAIPLQRNKPSILGCYITSPCADMTSSLKSCNIFYIILVDTDHTNVVLPATTD